MHREYTIGAIMINLSVVIAPGSLSDSDDYRCSEFITCCDRRCGTCRLKKWASTRIPVEKGSQKVNVITQNVHIAQLWSIFHTALRRWFLEDGTSLIFTKHLLFTSVSAPSRKEALRGSARLMLEKIVSLIVSILHQSAAFRTETMT